MDCNAQKFGYNRKLILETYMALGGIPYYWSFMKKGLSVAQNFDRMFFDEDDELAHEYEALYASLFKNPNVHIQIIQTLSRKKVGMTRAELILQSKLADNDKLSKALRELEQCGFIRQ